MTLDDIRNSRPVQPDHLWQWVHAFTGVRIAREPVCKCHQPPWEAFKTWVLNDPSMSLMLGPRGGGKSFLAALRTHIRSRWNPGHGARILGGSKAQSQQIYEALKKLVRDGHGPLGSDHDTLIDLLAERARYRNGSQVEILAASSRSVRGPHIPLLLLDEVDEIDPEHREAAFGMCVASKGVRASVSMTSTWHRLGGPMSELIAKAQEGKFPYHSFCIFEVLERCPESRSGANLENCPTCPLVKWCHADKDEHGGRPKAKRSDGHYAIDALIQKTMGVSARVFEADYLCTGPRADGLWFPAFSRLTHVSDKAEFDPALPVHLAVDSGVHSGAVWFQILETWTPNGPRFTVHVFADFYNFGKPAHDVAKDVLAVGETRCQGRAEYRSTDPAGGSRNPIGPTVLAEYAKAGLQLDRWPHGSVADGLSLVESFVATADGGINLVIHPRCTHLISAFQNYARAKRANQWIDQPEDPQHPAEDLMDALRGGLRKRFPEGRRPEKKLTAVPAYRMG